MHKLFIDRVMLKERYHFFSLHIFHNVYQNNLTLKIIVDFQASIRYYYDH